MNSERPFLKPIVMIAAGLPSIFVVSLLMVEDVPGARRVSGSTSSFQRTRLVSLAGLGPQSFDAGPAIRRNGVPCTFTWKAYCLQSELTSCASAGTRTDASQH